MLLLRGAVRRGRVAPRATSRAGDSRSGSATRIARDLASASPTRTGAASIHRDVGARGRPAPRWRHTHRRLRRRPRSSGRGPAEAGAQTSMGVGTPAYMSRRPAVGRGVRDALTSTPRRRPLGGAVGAPPFTGASTWPRSSPVVTEAPRRLIPRRRSTPPALSDAVLASLEEAAADRFGGGGVGEGDDGRWELSSCPVGDGTARRHRGGRTSRDHWRSCITPSPFLPGARIPATTIADHLLGTVNRKVTSDRGMEIEPTISPDGVYVAYAAGTTASMRIFQSFRFA